MLRYLCRTSREQRYIGPPILKKTHASQKFKMMKETLLKDIVQPKTRGVERGTIRTVLTSYTIADIFFEQLKG
jgi:hypothetical protein